MANMPRATDIAAYWRDRTIPGSDRPCFINPEQPCCMACHWWCEYCEEPCLRHLERAHVVPRASGGSDTDVSNFALLCKDCHLAAPDTIDAAWFWQWVAAQPVEDRFQKIVSRCTGIVSSLPPEMLRTLAEVPLDQLKEHLDLAERTLRPVVHAGRLSTSTWTRLLLEAAASFERATPGQQIKLFEVAKS